MKCRGCTELFWTLSEKQTHFRKVHQRRGEFDLFGASSVYLNVVSKTYYTHSLGESVILKRDPETGKFSCPVGCGYADENCNNLRSHLSSHKKDSDHRATKLSSKENDIEHHLAPSAHLQIGGSSLTPSRVPFQPITSLLQSAANTISTPLSPLTITEELGARPLSDESDHGPFQSPARSSAVEPVFFSETQVDEADRPIVFSEDAGLYFSDDHEDMPPQDLDMDEEVVSGDASPRAATAPMQVTEGKGVGDDRPTTVLEVLLDILPQHELSRFKFVGPAERVHSNEPDATNQFEGTGEIFTYPDASADADDSDMPGYYGESSGTGDLEQDCMGEDGGGNDINLDDLDEDEDDSGSAFEMDEDEDEEEDENEEDDENEDENEKERGNVVIPLLCMIIAHAV